MQTDRIAATSASPRVRPVTAMTEDAAASQLVDLPGFRSGRSAPKADDEPPSSGRRRAGRRFLLHRRDDLRERVGPNEPERPASSLADRAAEARERRQRAADGLHAINDEASEAQNANERFPDDQWARTRVGSARTASNWYEGVGAPRRPSTARWCRASSRRTRWATSTRCAWRRAASTTQQAAPARPRARELVLFLILIRVAHDI